MIDKINENGIIIYDDEIDFKELFLVIWNKKIFIGAITSIAAILSVIYALNLSNIYTSKALLAPASQEDSMSSKIGSFSAIASISGIPLPSGTGSKSQEAIERIKSFEFFSTYFLPNINLEDIMATKEWIPEDNILIYDSNVFNEVTGKWVKKIDPSAQQAYEVYQQTMSVTEDKKTSFITIRIDHLSPVIANEWVSIMT